MAATVLDFFLSDIMIVLCSVDRASLYNLVNETNFGAQNIFSVFRQFYL
jgi:hypothetical protein